MPDHQRFRCSRRHSRNRSARSFASASSPRRSAWRKTETAALLGGSKGCGVWRAAASSRSGRDEKAWSEDEVLQEMKKLSGTKFDPEIVDIFFDALPYLQNIRKKYPDRA